MHAAAQKIARALISRSSLNRCARKISRFARNDDAEKAILSFSACLRRISPLSFIPPVPYPPLRDTFPSRGRLWVWDSGILVSPPSPWQEGSWTSPSFLWKEVSRRGGGWLPQRDEREWGSPSSFRHPERSRGIFLVAAVYGIHAAVQKSALVLEFLLIPHSPFDRCARKISRCARNDDAGEETLRRGSVFA